MAGTKNSWKERYATFFLAVLLNNFQNGELVVPKFDCHPDAGATKTRCESRDCVWKESVRRNGEPECQVKYFDRWYRSSIEDSQGNSILEIPESSSWYGKDIPKLFYNFEEDASYIRLLFSKEPQNFSKDRSEKGQILAKKMESPRKFPGMFRFGVYRRNRKERPESSKLLLGSPEFPSIVFSDQYVQISILLPTRNFFGIGEQYHTSLKRKFEWEKLALFTRDHEPQLQWENKNVYGFQPIGMGLDKDGKAFGIFFNNTHGMNVQFQPNPPIITIRAMGGPIDLYILPGPTPNQVVQQLTHLIGKPFLPPYWSLGYHLCRYGYRNLSELETVWDRNRAAGIPQDVQFIDIDYMDGEKDFTFSPTRFKQLPDFVKRIHESGRKLMLIFDPAISSEAKNYSPLSKGLKLDIFVSDNRTGKPFEAKCWPGKTYWPDFTNPKALQYWTKECEEFRKKIAFDGIWLDMNDPSNFVSGSLTGCENNSLNRPPFNPLAYDPIYSTTLCLSARQHLGYHYEWHNFYGHYEAKVTHEALKQVHPGQRPFILTRSTSPGTGSYAAHWTGDNSASWEQLNHTLITNLEFSIFAIPMVGSDICGFNGDSNEELCLRWSQVGAFYPYSRNHNDAGAKVDQDPAAWSHNTTEAIRKVLLMRYALLPYLYTLLVKAHLSGSAVMRPLYFEFPKDSKTHNIHQQFLWGSSLMIVPILEPFTEETNAYFPRGVWYDVNNIYKSTNGHGKTGRRIRTQIPKSSIGLYVRGGHIIPWQLPDDNTEKSRRNPMGIVIGLKPRKISRGELLWDDGISLDSFTSGKYCQVMIKATAKWVKIISKKADCPDIPRLKYVHVAGMKSKPAVVLVNGTPLAKSAIRYAQPSRALFLTLHVPINLKSTNAVMFK